MKNEKPIKKPSGFSRPSLSQFCFAVFTAAAIAANPADPVTLDPKLESLRPFIGKTWRGEFKESTPAKPVIDISRWERALNGKAVRILHSINDGSYGGESLVTWDAEKNQITYHYFTTAGFQTVGVMTCTSNILTAVEKVHGNANGITEVRSTYELRPDGTLLNRSSYIKDGQPSGPGREVVYKEDAKAEVKFK